VDDVDDGEVSSVTARGIVDMLERDNKSLVQRSRELEKQLHILRAAGSRMPPSKSVFTLYSVYNRPFYHMLMACVMPLRRTLASSRYRIHHLTCFDINTSGGSMDGCTPFG